MTAIVCTPELANSVACFERATTLSGDDLISGMQAMGPNRIPQSAGIPLPLLASYIGSGPGGPFLPLIGGTVSGPTTFQNTLTLSAGGSLAGTFTGAPTFSGAVTIGGTTTLGSAQTNYTTVAGGSGGASIVTSGAGPNASLALRSLGSGASGAVNIGPSTGGNVLSIIGASSSGNGTITLTQPASTVLPFTFGLTTNKAGVQWTNFPQRFQNTIAWAGLSTAVANRSVQIVNNLSGTIQDPNASVAPAIPFSVINTLTGFNAGGQGLRGAWFQAVPAAGTYGPTITGLWGSVAQTGAPGPLIAWQASTSYPTVGAIVISPANSQIYRVETAGTSATVAPTGSTFTDGSVSWSLQGPGSAWVQAIGGGFQGQSNFNAGGIASTAAVTFTNGSANIGWTNTLVSGNHVYFTVTGGSLPTNFSPNTNYYVLATGLTGFNIQVSATPGGAAIVAASAGSGSPIGNNPAGGANVGVQWGGLISSGATANATNYSESNGLEVDDNFQGAGISKTTGIQIVKLGQSGVFTDIGLSISCNGAAVGRYKNTIRLLNATETTGYAFSSYNQNNTNGQQHLAGWLDGRLVVPNGNGQFGGGFFLRWGNGSINQDGGVRVRYGSIQPTSSGVAIDVPLVELTTLNVTNGGANWSVGQQWQGDDGSSGIVAAVTGGPPGSISTGTSSLTIVTPSQHLTPPSTVTITAISVSLGLVGTTGNPIWPTAAIATPTYAAPGTPTLSLMPSGGAIKLGSGAFTANGSTAVSLTSIAPSGAHATVQEWLTITDSSGTVRYIPCF